MQLDRRGREEFGGGDSNSTDFIKRERGWWNGNVWLGVNFVGHQVRVCRYDANLRTVVGCFMTNCETTI